LFWCNNHFLLYIDLCYIDFGLISSKLSFYIKTFVLRSVCVLLYGGEVDRSLHRYVIFQTQEFNASYNVYDIVIYEKENTVAKIFLKMTTKPYNLPDKCNLRSMIKNPNFTSQIFKPPIVRCKMLLKNNLII
jgi:hypothetical protein